ARGALPSDGGAAGTPPARGALPSDGSAAGTPPTRAINPVKQGCSVNRNRVDDRVRASDGRLAASWARAAQKGHPCLTVLGRSADGCRLALLRLSPSRWPPSQWAPAARVR